MPHVYVSQFTHYLAAKSETDAERAVRMIRQQLEAPRGFNYWQGITNALLADRRGTRDGQALIDAAAKARPQQRAPYALAAQGWAQLAPWWDGLEHERLQGQVVQIGDLPVKVPRLIAERHPDGELEVLFPRFSKVELRRHVTFGVMRIVQLAHPGARVTFVDVPQLVTYSSRDRDLTAYDEWLTVAGNDLAEQLRDILGRTEGQARAA